MLTIPGAARPSSSVQCRNKTVREMQRRLQAAHVRDTVTDIKSKAWSSDQGNGTEPHFSFLISFLVLSVTSFLFCLFCPSFCGLKLHGIVSRCFLFVFYFFSLSLFVRTEGWGLESSESTIVMKQNACATTRESTFSRSINCFILTSSSHAVWSSWQVIPSQVGVMEEGSRFYQGQGRTYIEHIKD